MSVPIKTEGIVFHWRRHSETSLIVEWWTRDRGLLHTMAKGALRPHHKNRMGLDIFQCGDLTYTPGRRSSLHTLIDFLPRKRFPGIQKNYGKLLAAAYAYDLSRHFVEPDAPAAEVYDLLCRFLDFLDRQPLEAAHILHLENRFFALLGLGSLDDCLNRPAHHPNPHQFRSYQNLKRHLS